MPPNRGKGRGSRAESCKNGQGAIMTISRKHQKNRKTKFHLVFDENLRREYLTGFRARKKKRKEEAQARALQREKERLKQIRDEKVNRLRELSLKRLKHLEEAFKSETFELEGHTVTIDEIDPNKALMGSVIGSNNVVIMDGDEEVDRTEDGSDGNEEAGAGGRLTKDASKEKLKKLHRRTVLNKSERLKVYRRRKKESSSGVKQKKGGKRK